jgi:hypothetical protein
VNEFAGVKKEASAYRAGKLMGKVTLIYYSHYDNLPDSLNKKRTAIQRGQDIPGLFSSDG